MSSHSDAHADHAGTVMFVHLFVQYQNTTQCKGTGTHCHLLSPRTLLYAHGATRGPPGCTGSTAEPELQGCMCCSTAPSDAPQHHSNLELQKAAVLVLHTRITCLRKKINYLHMKAAQGLDNQTLSPIIFVLKSSIAHI